LNYPVNIVFSDRGNDKALAYITELYNGVKVIDKHWNLHSFMGGLLNFEPVAAMPGKGESGVTGICVDPEKGGVFVSLVYADNSDIKNKIIRMKSADGITCDDSETVLEGIPSTLESHQIQDLTIGPDGKLYVNVGDGGEWRHAPQDENDLRGKILRLELDGSIPDDNPIQGSPVYAKGLRNPFGAAWRKSEGCLYVSVNGPETDDVITKISPLSDHGWYPDMRKNALFWWHYTQAPTALDFMQGQQFPAVFKDELFVALFGYAYQEGPSAKGKRIVKLRINEDATGVRSYDDFAVYTGDGPGAPCGLSFGPEGLYFTDLHEGVIYLIKPQEGYASEKNT